LLLAGVNSTTARTFITPERRDCAHFPRSSVETPTLGLLDCTSSAQQARIASRQLFGNFSHHEISTLRQQKAFRPTAYTQLNRISPSFIVNPAPRTIPKSSSLSLLSVEDRHDSYERWLPTTQYFLAFVPLDINPASPTHFD
jgi:hypothetical protein